ncbi:sugar ABC transporter permease [Paraburkholderia bryophila]|uniref:sugar ABC transporter permease n=1 Tax=Paraburkholderia bryophila TaxID=420952 RepID=UPI002349978D|nr:sugar ABC transporter permease [Paraburkholderia bryophila]WCM24590.1 sugar ABC transporter permease [Paraburkholderia bryophila]
MRESDADSARETTGVGAAREAAGVTGVAGVAHGGSASRSGMGSALLAMLAGLAGIALQLAVFSIAAHGAPDTSAQWLGGLPDDAPSGDAARLNTHTLLLCLLIQALAALLISLAIARALPPRYRAPRKGVLAALWFLNFALPIGGVACTLGALAIAGILPRPPERLPVTQVDEPEFAANLIGNVSYGRGARLKAELQNADAGTAFRMTALLAMQSMPARTVSPLLQGMLADPLDDIRLLAYGILDNREKALTQRILVERPKLDRKLHPELNDTDRRRANKTLAELYSELIYEHLVTGDVYRNAADQADGFAIAALDADPDDASLWRLRGRLALDRRELDNADTMLQRAIDCGFPRERMLPYLAEAAYLRRDFARVRRLLREMDSHAGGSTLHAVLAFWQGRDAGATTNAAGSRDSGGPRAADADAKAHDAPDASSSPNASDSSARDAMRRAMPDHLSAPDAPPRRPT